MRLNKAIVSAAVSLSLLLPGMVQAATLTSNQVNAIIMLLQSFGADPSVVSSVQATLTGASVGSSTPSTPQWMPPGQVGKAMCIALNRNLGIGSSGDDVKSLQEMLQQDPESGFTNTATGYFGPLTQHAMARFQLNNGIASSSAATGDVGPLTRGFFERRCGEGLGNEQNDQQGGQIMAGVVTGTISTSSSSSIIVSMQNGQTRTVNITASTTIAVFAGTSTPPTTGTIANLTVGATVAASGLPQQDGSLTALNITVGVTLPPLQPTEGGQSGDHSQGGDH